MNGVKISQLPIASSEDGVIPIVQNGVTNRINVSEAVLGNSLVMRSPDGDIEANVLRGEQLESEATQGTSPLIIASTTEVENLNTEFVGGLKPAQAGAGHLVYADVNKDVKVEGNYYSDDEIIATENKAIAYSLIFG